MPKLVTYLRSSNYWLFAIFAWILSFLLISDSQWVNNFTYLFLLVPLLLTITTKELSLFIKDGVGVCLMLLCLIMVVAAITHGEPLRQAKYGLMIILFYLAVSRLPDFSTEDAWKYAWLIFFILIIYVVINMGFHSLNDTWRLKARLAHLTGRVSNPIFVTDLIMVFLAVITATSLKLQKFRSLILAHLIALVLTLFILQSRSMIPVWAVILLLASYHIAIHHKKHMKVFLAGGATVILLVSLGILCTDYADRIIESDSYRLEIWHGYIRETLNCGIFLGCGIDHPFQFVTKNGQEISHAHNIYVALLFKGGVFACLTLITMIIWAVSMGLKRNYWAAWMLAAGAIALFFDGNSIINSPNESWLILHLPLALVLASLQHQIALKKQSNFN